MKSTLLRVAVLAVRAWARAYTSGLPPQTMEARRAEIESDLWESLADAPSESVAAIEILGRLLRGMADDLLWRTERSGGTSRAVRIAIALSATTALLAVGWVGLLSSPGESPKAPPAPILWWRPSQPPPPPPPPPPRMSAITMRSWPSKTIGGAVAMGLAIVDVHGRSRPGAPLDAIATIVDAFRDRAVVAIDEPHGDEQAHAFRVALVRHPAFAAVVNDILVEFGNARYQHTIDRFVAGGRVADSELRHVWQDTTQAHTIWDRPIYEDFFRAVREVNRALPEHRRLRVLLGDPPIDWDAIRTPDDLARARRSLPGRSEHPADVLIRESLSKGRRALVIYGGLHLIRQNAQGPNLVERLETVGRTRTFVILTHPFASLDTLGVDHVHWPVPGLALTAGSSLANQADAILYLGPGSSRTFSRLTVSLCSDRRYQEMRARRIALVGRTDATEMLEKECPAR